MSITEVDLSKAFFYFHRASVSRKEVAERAGKEARRAASRAYKDLAVAIEKEVSNTGYLTLQGIWFFDDRKYDDAFASFSRAIQLSPKVSPYFFSQITKQVAENYYWRGMVYKEGKGDIQSSIPSFDFAIDLDANNPLYFACRGLLTSATH